MDLDTPLRKKLFDIAENPQNCADASAEVFNTMGIEALASQARAYSTSRAELEERLVRLAKGAARLNRVDEIARADALSRPSRAEEVEIYLTYQTHLAKRLDLPWQSESLLHRDIAGVTDEALSQAFDTVLEREEGDGLVNGMLELSFWDKYLNDRYPERFQANEQFYNRQLDLLEDLRTASETGEPITAQNYSDRVSDLAYARQEPARDLTRELLQKHGL